MRGPSQPIESEGPVQLGDGYLSHGRKINQEVYLQERKTHPPERKK